MPPVFTDGASEEARALIDALDALTARDEMRRYKLRSYGLIPADARRILDVGCGTGDDVLALAELCGPATEVVGLDRRLELVREAERRARNVALKVRFVLGEAHSLPFADQVFDLVRADCLLGEVDDTGCVLSELVRVVRRSGRVIVHERDPSTGSGGTASSARAGAQPELVDVLHRAGLQSVQVVDVWPWLAGRGLESSQGITVVGTKPAQLNPEVPRD